MAAGIAKIIFLEAVKAKIATTAAAIKKYLKLAVPKTPIFKTYSVNKAPKTATTGEIDITDRNFFILNW